MGHGSYSVENRSTSYLSRGIDLESASMDSLYTAKSIQVPMNPKGLTVRESRDSDEHPNSVGIILALDVTGSMMQVPNKMVRDDLPTIVTKIIQGGTTDPQILFLGIGDHEWDNAPLQVGQFESSDELMDKWLTSIYLEKGGGGNIGESYMLAWYIAAFHTSIDCFEKRKMKGFLFTVGDEPVLPNISARHLKDIMGDGQYSDYDSKDLLAKAQEKYHVFHIHVKETGAGSRKEFIDSWKEVIGQNLIVVESHTEIPQKIAEVITSLNKSSETKGIDHLEDSVGSIDDMEIL